jgi:hypothetical protein
MVLATLDPLAAMAAADEAKLEELLRDLVPTDDALARMLAQLADQNGILWAGLTDPDEVPALPDEADVYIKPGELYRLGDHRLLNCFRRQSMRPIRFGLLVNCPQGVSWILAGLIRSVP